LKFELHVTMLYHRMLGAIPQTPGVLRLPPMGRVSAGLGPLADCWPQSTTLRVTDDEFSQAARHQPIAARKVPNPVLFRLGVRF
jgi:hypothetical protein